MSKYYEQNSNDAYIPKQFISTNKFLLTKDGKIDYKELEVNAKEIIKNKEEQYLARTKIDGLSVLKAEE